MEGSMRGQGWTSCFAIVSQEWYDRGDPLIRELVEVRLWRSVPVVRFGASYFCVPVPPWGIGSRRVEVGNFQHRGQS